MKILQCAIRVALALALAALVAVAAAEIVRAVAPEVTPLAPPRRFVHPIWVVPIPREEGGIDPCPR